MHWLIPETVTCSESSSPLFFLSHLFFLFSWWYYRMNSWQNLKSWQNWKIWLCLFGGLQFYLAEQACSPFFFHLPKKSSFLWIKWLEKPWWCFNRLINPNACKMDQSNKCHSLPIQIKANCRIFQIQKAAWPMGKKWTRFQESGHLMKKESSSRINFAFCGQESAPLSSSVSIAASSTK